MNDQPTLADFPAHSHDKLRYGDTDRQGHVNNAVFATLLETGRIEVLRDVNDDLNEDGLEWVIARLTLDFLGEILWPGQVDVGTRVQRLGTTSVGMEQALYQDGRIVARAETVIVQMDAATRRPAPLSETARERFAALQP
ncbi:thioesterase family protein [Nocardioides sp.]|uniref:acyl-CoA thioesterase n=1 Tax=Nocardioides sp. TaxID=35761 RepID=UPI002B273088|nr:thioesterase family protein [Nocardioides sp.]